MAQGKFSKPRKRFTEESPAVPPIPEEPVVPVAEPRIEETDMTEKDLSLEEMPAGTVELSVSEDTNGPRFSSPGKGIPKKLWIALLAGVLGIGIIVGSVFGIIALTDPYDCRIVDNVTIGGTPVGGMTKGEARKALKAELEKSLYGKDMVVSLPEEVLRMAASDTGIEVDISAAVKEAYRIGRTGTAEEKQAAYASAVSNGCSISLEHFLSCNTDYIRNLLQNYADKYDTRYADFSYTLKGEKPALEEELFSSDAPCQTLVITRGMPQRELDVEAVFRQILAAYGENRLLLEIDEIEPLAVPELPDIAAIYEEISVAPVDAAVSFETYQPVPGDYGYTFDKDTARSLVNQAQDGETVEIPMEYVEPEILQDEVFFRDVLGSCETKHTNDENRNTNLRLLCEALDGMILQPGEEFSYNDSVGERTRERGYLPAGAYSGVELVQDVGGGVCQGSTTLYNCVLLADLEVVFRINHGFTVSYVPFGLDATVNWGGPDFKFKNSSNFPIMILAEVSDGYVKMKIMGTDEKDYYIKMETEYGYGETGIYARSYKCKYDKETDELISRDLEARSAYMLH